MSKRAPSCGRSGGSRERAAWAARRAWGYSSMKGASHLSRLRNVNAVAAIYVAPMTSRDVSAMTKAACA